jgi:hypothetical protein
MHEGLVKAGLIFIIDIGDPGGPDTPGWWTGWIMVSSSPSRATPMTATRAFRRTDRRVRDINVGFIDYGAR